MFKKFRERRQFNKIKMYAERGLEELRKNTPQDTGITAESWSFEILQNKSGVSIYWKNSSLTEDGIPIVILLQYGHDTGTGGYVEGRDFINPTMKPVFDNIAENVWREVTSNG